MAADEPYYSQKYRHHGMNVAVLARPDGTALWYSRALPGRTHDLTAARAHGVIQACLTRQILVLADRAYPNRALAQARAPIERGVTRLKPWRFSRRSRCSPNRMTDIAAAVLTLESRASSSL